MKSIYYLKSMDIDKQMQEIKQYFQELKKIKSQEPSRGTLDKNITWHKSKKEGLVLRSTVGRFQVTIPAKVLPFVKIPSKTQALCRKYGISFTNLRMAYLMRKEMNKFHNRDKKENVLIK